MKIMELGKRDLFSRVMQKTGMNAVSRMIRIWRGLLVVNYHRIGNEAATQFDRNVFSADQDVMEKQMKFYKKNFDVLSMNQLLGMSPEQLAKGQYVLVTFDDGYRDNYELAFPVIRDLKIPVTIFIATGFIDRGNISFWDEIAWMIRKSTNTKIELPEHQLSLELGETTREKSIRCAVSKYWTLNETKTEDFLNNMAEVTGSGRCPIEISRDLWMTWNMIREMSNSGISFGAHTVNHVLLHNSNLENVRYEVAESKRRLEEELQLSVETFSYPVGGKNMFNKDVKQILAEAGIQLAFSFYGDYYRGGSWDPYDIPRTGISTGYTLDYVRTMLTWPQFLSVWQ